MGIYIPNASLPQYGHRIAILSDGYAYYEDMQNPYKDLGKAMLVPDHDDLIPVRCHDDCYWIRQDWGDKYTPPSTECGKDEKRFAELNIDPCCGERDDVQCPDCPFYLNYETISRMKAEYDGPECLEEM